MPNSNSKLVQPNAWAEQGIRAIAEMVKAKLASAGSDEQHELMSMLEELIFKADWAKLREFNDKTEKIKEAYANKERVSAENFEKLQEAKRVRADGIAKLDEEYTAVTVKIRKRVEAEEAFIAKLDNENEELRKELRAWMSWGLPEEDVNRIMAPDMPKARQMTAAKPTWASKVAGMATATEEGTAMETNVPMSAQELRELEEAIRPK
ncbi:hypothetical protein FBU31_001562 [Coemansia sp. 'formosensis']|nr:hypothetical protein FBU31_001562 [Coemansia sp. 'formosensis']